MTAEVLGLDSFDEAEFKSKIAFISVLSDTEIAFHFLDGRIENRQWDFARPTHKWTEEQNSRIPSKVLLQKKDGSR